MKTLQITQVIFITNFFELVKMVLTPEEWPSFTSYMEEFRKYKKFFSNFLIRHIPRIQNAMADKLSRGARSSFAWLYINYVLPVWLSELVVASIYF